MNRKQSGTTQGHHLPNAINNCCALASSVMILLAGQPLHGQTGQDGKMQHPRHSKLDLHAEELKFRRLQLQDEKGEIPTNAWLKAAAQRKAMLADAKARARGRGQISPAPGAAELAQATPSPSPAPEIAGVQSSGWNWLGPGNIGGRVRSILIHPNFPNIMWVGSVGGGVWKTTTGGASWFPLDDFMPNLAIACMVMDPSNPDIIYAGTGEGYGNGDAIQGAGIFKTMDGGASWAQIPSTASANFSFVNRLAISPTDSQTILAATANGVFRSTDGGASWNNAWLSAALGRVPLTFATLDLAFDPSDASKCIASGMRFALYSSDGGMTWKAATGLPAPTGLQGRVELAYALSNPSTVYASVDNNSGEVYRSTDGGQSYSRRSTGDGYLEDQGWYGNCIWVDPTNPNRLIVGGINLWRSTDGGANFTHITDWRVANSIHADQHIIIQPPSFDGNTVNTVFVGNDGGVFRASDIFASFPPSIGWTELNNNLGITQFYSAAGDPSNGRVIAGAQDNGTVRYNPADGTEGWDEINGGDGGFCAVDPTHSPDPSYVYGEYIYLQIFRSVNGGSQPVDIYNGDGTRKIDDAGEPAEGQPDKANFIAPFILDPNHLTRILAGGLSLWRSSDSLFTTWSAIKAPIGPPSPPGTRCANCISAIAVAPGNSDIIWVGHNDGSVYVTVNGTADNPNWTQVGFALFSGHRFCTRIAIDPSKLNRVYVTFGGFTRGNVWRTDDGGTTWADISHNLPQAPVYSLVIAPHAGNFLYLGTEVGVFASSDYGGTWSPNNDGPANVQVRELSWMSTTLIAATHGRGCYSIRPLVWVDFNYTGTAQDGTYESPFKTLAQGISAVSPGGNILIRSAGSTSEKPMLAKPMTIMAVGGPATIGR